MTWQVGDLALVVGSGHARATRVAGSPKLGSIVRVTGVVSRAVWTALIIDGFPAPHFTGGWCANSFRKIHPDELKACEPEFVTLLKRSKVTASGTPTRRAETTGSVGEADGGPVPKADAQ